MNAYHGSTVASASLGGMAAMHGQSGLPIEGIHHIGQPYWFGEGRETGMTPEEFGLARARELEAKLLELGPRPSPPSSPSRSRGPAASSFRRPATGPRSSASAAPMTSCWSSTR